MPLLDKYRELVPVFTEMKELVEEYMKLTSSYRSEITGLTIAIESISDDAIVITCEYCLFHDEACSFGWFIHPDVLFGDRANWKAAIDDYIRVYIPSWLSKD